MHATYDLGLCITDAVANDSPQKQEQRFKLFRDIGIRSARMELEWEAVEPQKGLIVKPQKLSHFHTAVRYGMRLKLVGVRGGYSILVTGCEARLGRGEVTGI